MLKDLKVREFTAKEARLLNPLKCYTILTNTL